mmetsp:Transcript_37438/g.85108  ORF Transcript_37438/g.85108 Transcript_37438/m.85108 type:complete len:262 (+) Transcript_37438:238-1023(+)
MRRGLRVAPRDGPLELGLQGCSHTSLKIPLEVVEPTGVALIHVVEPDLEPNGRDLLVAQLVHQSNACYHIGRLYATADDSQDDVVPQLVDRAAAKSGLQLQLEVATLCVLRVLPLRSDPFSEDHQGVNDGLATILFSNELLAVEELTGLRQVVPAGPEILDGAEGSRLLGDVSPVRLLVLRLDVLLPDRPSVLQLGVALLQLLQLRWLGSRAEVACRRDLGVEAQERSLELLFRRLRALALLALRRHGAAGAWTAPQRERF